jgi:hypothetical protein
MASMTSDSVTASRNRNLHVATTGIPDIDRAGEQYARLRDELRDVGRRLIAVKNSRKDAEAADARSFARAITAGTADPGPNAAQKVSDEIAELTRRQAALEIAVAESAASFEAIHRSRRGDLVNMARDRVDAARDRIVELVDALAAARVEQQNSEFFLQWSQQGPGRKPPKHERGGEVAGLVDRGGRVQRFDDVAAALRATADPPPPPPELP